MIILKHDRKRYIPKEALRMQNKYGGHIGSAIYLPSGRGIAELFNFFNSNKDAIKSVTDTVSNVTSAVGSVAKFATDTAKGIEEIKAMRQRNQGITETAMNSIINNEESIKPEEIKKSVRAAKKGGAFYQV